MEPLAYLHLAQVYESSEMSDCVLLQNLGVSIGSAHCKRWAIVSLVSAVSATWLGGAPTVALAEDYVAQECVSQECVPVISNTGESQATKEFVPVILGARYVKSYAGGSYYYILEDGQFDSRPAYAVVESSYHPVSPAPAPAQPLCGVFQPGDSGSGVACVQELLQAAGYFHGAITGYFGPVTCDAVIAFQRDHGLYADGVAGPETLDALNRI